MKMGKEWIWTKLGLVQEKILVTQVQTNENSEL